MTYHVEMRRTFREKRFRFTLREASPDLFVMYSSPDFNIQKLE